MKKQSHPPERPHPPTMKDVARRAGVSTSTVSLVLRNHPSIPEPTRQRILKIQREMGYQVNRYAHEFVRHTRGHAPPRHLEHVEFCMVDMDVSGQENAYTPFLQGIITECRNRDLLLSLRSIHRIVGEGSVPPLSRSRADGVIVSGHLDDDTLFALLQSRLPLIVLGNYRLSHPAHRIELDLLRVGEQLAEHLVAQGHRTIAFAAEHLHPAYEQKILLGARDHLERNQREIPESHRIITNHYASTGAEFIAPFLRLDPRPTAIITTDIHTADNFVSELRTRQVKVPEEVEVVSLCTCARMHRNPFYRAIDLQLDRCGTAAVARLADLFQQPDTPPVATVLAAGEWLPRL